MRFFKNRILRSFVVILGATLFWEFEVKQLSGPIYTQAVSEYKSKNYAQSLDLLQRAYLIDQNDTAIMTLMGWNYLKLGLPQRAEYNFARAHKLAPRVLDTVLGLAYTEVALKKYEDAAGLLRVLMRQGVNTSDVHTAWATIYREEGRNRDAAHEFQIALAMEKNNEVATKNLQELYNTTGDVRDVSVELQPRVRATALNYPARVEGDFISWKVGTAWKPEYLAGVDLTPTLPGHFMTDAPIDPAIYQDWLQKISDLSANTIRVYTILPPAFYRTLYQFNNTPSRKPLRLLQGISLGDATRNDLFGTQYYQFCQKQIRDTLDAIHGQGDFGTTPAYEGGIYPNDVSPWVTGFVIGQTWLSHQVSENDQMHPEIKAYLGNYVEVVSGSPTEIFLAHMLNYAAEYEEDTYNWQHPVAFLNWPPLDPLRHPTESTTVEEAIIRRNLGERFPFPGPPYNDNDGVSLDPTHLRPRERLVAGYFSAYSAFPYFPDFINNDPRYQQVTDAEGRNPFLGYLQDLKSYHRGLPLVITEYQLPDSIGVGHFSSAGFDQGGKTEEQQGKLLARFTQNIHAVGAAGGMVFEWVDQWFRQTWPVQKFEVPQEHKPLWANLMDPAESCGLTAAEPRRRSVHHLSGDPSEWANLPPVYAQQSERKFNAVGDRYDPARMLKALYADADEGFLYLRLEVQKLDNNNDGKPDWDQVNYVIGMATAPGQAGMTVLPYIAPVNFPMGMTYAIHLDGPESANLWVASSYNPFQIADVDGIPNQTYLAPKLGWKPSLSSAGTFEPQWIEPNSRHFGRDGKYYPPQRYDRGILRYGSLDPKSSEYDSLAEWHADVRTNTIDLRIPWNLLNVTDPSKFKIVAGISKDGSVQTADTSGILLVVFSYRPLELSRLFPIMEQVHPIADALPGMTGPSALLAAGLKEYRWEKWNTPQYNLRLKDSYAIVRRAFLQLPHGR